MSFRHSMDCHNRNQTAAVRLDEAAAKRGLQLFQRNARIVHRPAGGVDFGNILVHIDIEDCAHIQRDLAPVRYNG